ncbi:MAG: hypothetical protein HY836_03355 [Aquabacterium sp.]|uniref:hypothetical protein n=1 Tax=Aquabacterium sp. TaxID=1872578 RepID=UPI0025BAA71D|nr:hypothetical protein [Aquabacterium sp.]MBI5924610.1 hypothetical protein [Aquabacterium sp.]
MFFAIGMGRKELLDHLFYPFVAILSVKALAAIVLVFAVQIGVTGQQTYDSAPHLETH